jgi:ArsR family transcriptional regulator
MPEKTEKSERPARTDAKLSKKSVTPPEREAALDLAAMQFKALGDPTRLRILCLLGEQTELPAAVEEIDTPKPEAGITVGDVSLGLYGKAKVSSTLSHHLKELRNAGLILMKRRGKNLMCRIQPDAVLALRAYLCIPRGAARVKAAVGAGPKRIRAPKPKEGGTQDDTNYRDDNPTAV